MTAMTSCMPGRVVAVHVAVGERVAPGDRLLTVETMKCESTVTASAGGRIATLLRVGDLVTAGAVVAIVDANPVASPAVRPADAVQIALEGWGRAAVFQELDLMVEGPAELVRVERPLGHQPAGIVVGLMSHQFEGQARPTERVWLAGDPSRAMGAVAEAECRRIIAAFDLAHRRGIPVEWVAVSAGAQISLESGTENMDWCAAVVRRILEFTEAGGEVVLIVCGINVGAQSYWNAAATMLLHCAGLLVMVDGSAMVLTGRRALAVAGCVSAASDVELGGYPDVMGPNGQAHHRAPTLREAYDVVLTHHRLLSPAAPHRTNDPIHRDVCAMGYQGHGGHGTVGDILDGARNPSRTLPFEVRPVMAALADADLPRLERWADMQGADGAVVWDTAIGGQAVTLIGIESHPRPGGGHDGPSGPGTVWAAGTLYPGAAKKIARGITHASGRRPVVVLANLAGFDGSAWSLRNNQLEWGAEIARSVVNFRGPILVVTIGRFHGGSYVVFNKALNPQLRMMALAGTKVSVIGGSAAAEVVLTRQVRERAAQECDATDALPEEALRSARAEVAARFDAVHSVDRAYRAGSIDTVIEPAQLRPAVAAHLAAAHVELPALADVGGLRR